MSQGETRVPDALLAAGRFPTLRFDGATVIEFRHDLPVERAAVTITTNLMVAVIAGKKIVHTPAGDFTSGPGSVLFFPANTYCMSEILSREEGLYRRLMVFFDDRFLEGFVAAHPALAGEAARAPGERPYIYRMETTPFLQSSLDTLLEAFVRPHAAGEAWFRTLLTSTFLNLLDAAGPDRFRLFLRDWLRSRSPSLTQALEESLAERVPLEEVARRNGMSLSAFKRTFTRSHGVAPGRWLTERRLERARWALMQDDAPVTEIALACGFSSLSHFIQSFKRRYGLTPHQYRKEPQTTLSKP